ncbi:MAG TPA: kelch repeat-containing protein, partial [Desulfobaccales bacterium]|nr:kelch repeat-containing protein [Desulfobaccales bacterium]
MTRLRKSLSTIVLAYRLAAVILAVLTLTLLLPQTALAATNTWGPTGAPAINRAYHTITQLPNGKILIAGGWNSTGGGTYLASAELYDPVAKTWSPTGDMAAERYNHTATLLPNGKVLVVG